MTIIFPRLGQAGRLGNQLFQVASALGIAESRGEDVRFPEWDYRPYFSIPDEFFGAQIGTDAADCAPHIDPRARVYLQDLNLFAHIEPKVHSYFHPSERAWNIMMDSTNRWVLELPPPVVVMHVRRGDNVTHPQGFHPLRSMTYYQTALSFTPPEATVLVLSDDIPWCRQNVPSIADGREVFFYDGVARPREYMDRVEYETSPVLDWVDLQLGAAVAEYVVMSNSTYSWWIAYLASPSARRFYPSRWFGRELQYIDSSLMFPKSRSWVELDDPTMGGV